MSANARVEIACSHCSQKVAVDRSKLGGRGRCPRCQQIFVLALPPASPRRAEDERENEPINLEAPARQSSPTLAADLWGSDSRPANINARQQPPQKVQPPPISTPPAKRSLAEDYLRRAQEAQDTPKEEEQDMLLRFMTSYGSVIGGSVVFLLGLASIVFFISFRLGILLLIVGSGWFVQGMNYIFYNRWRDSQR